MTRLDETRAYGTVYDVAGVRYEQDNRYFRANGTAVDEEPPAEAQSADPASRGWSPDDLRRPENKALKAQLDVYDEPWTTAQAARDFSAKGRA